MPADTATSDTISVVMTGYGYNGDYDREHDLRMDREMAPPYPIRFRLYDRWRDTTYPQFWHGINNNWWRPELCRSDIFSARLRDSYGYVDSTGRMLIKPQFTSAGGFYGDYAIVHHYSRQGLIDTAGNFKWPLGWGKLQQVLPAQNRFIYRHADTFALCDEHKNVLFNFSGIEDRRRPQRYPNDLMFVLDQEYYPTFRDYGDRHDGPSYDPKVLLAYAMPLDRGSAWKDYIRYESNEGWGVIDVNGKELIKPTWQYIQFHDNGLLEVQDKSGRRLLMDIHGRKYWE